MAKGLESQSVEDKDAAELAGLGYKQELRRDWGLLQNFGASFSIISVVTGITTLFEYGLTTGGPGVMTVGWIVVLFFTNFVSMSMAEIVSAIPTSGGPYFWAFVLSPRKHAPFMSWATGWFNLIGQIAVTTGISFGGANLISTLATVLNDYEPTAARTIGIYAAILVSHGIINTFGVHILKYVNNLSIFLHSAGVFSIAVAVVAGAPTHQSAKFVFASFYDGTAVGDAEGWSMRASPAYLAICGVLMSQYTITGFDASAHMSEETRNAGWSAPMGVVTSIGVSALFGFFYLVCLLFSIQDFDNTVNSPYGQPVLQIFADIYGPNGAVALMSIVILCVYCCGLFSLTSNSRMMFAFARDGALPHFFATVHPTFRSPVATIWLAALGAFCLALPSLGSSVAFTAATSIATIGLYISYGLPILAGLIWPHLFKKGPFHLGKFSRPIALVACLWIMFIVIAFSLPTLNPVNSQTLNYTPVAVGIVVIWVFASWLWARHWFEGPRKQIEAAELGININDPEEFDQAEREHRLPSDHPSQEKVASPTEPVAIEKS